MYVTIVVRISITERRHTFSSFFFQIHEFKAEEIRRQKSPSLASCQDRYAASAMRSSIPNGKRNNPHHDAFMNGTFSEVKADIRNIKQTIYCKTWRAQLKCMYKTEWFTVAMVIDRLLFGIFLISGLTAGLITFLA